MTIVCVNSANPLNALLSGCKWNPFQDDLTLFWEMNQIR